MGCATSAAKYSFNPINSNEQNAITLTWPCGASAAFRASPQFRGSQICRWLQNLIECHNRKNVLSYYFFLGRMNLIVATNNNAISWIRF